MPCSKCLAVDHNKLSCPLVICSFCKKSGHMVFKCRRRLIIQRCRKSKKPSS